MKTVTGVCPFNELTESSNRECPYMGQSGVCKDFEVSPGNPDSWCLSQIDANRDGLLFTGFVESLYEKCPGLKKDGLDEFDGYFTTYDRFLMRMENATGEQRSYGNDPLELIVELANERDSAIENANHKIQEVAMDFVKKIRATTRLGYSARTGIEDGCEHSLNSLELIGLKKFTSDIKECLDSILGDAQGIDNVVHGIFPSE